MRRKLSPLPKLTIKPDQPLLFPVFNKQGALLAEKGTFLSDEQIKKILSLDEIFTDERALLSALIGDSKKDKQDGGAFQLPPPFKRLTALETILHEILDNPEDSINQSKVLTIINRLQTICQKSPDAAIAKIITDDNSDYAVKHPIHTAILCELSGLHLKWSLEKRRNVIGAALTMNISLGYLQNELLSQSKPLSTKQQKIINSHPSDSATILKKMGVSNKIWLETVNKHHENIDGTGYPSNLTQKDIPLAASLVSLSDVYCAKVSGRNYREPIFANVAVRDIYLEKDHSHEGTLIEVFVKLLGIYPPGCIVKLQSDEIGIVTRRGRAVDAPEVLVLNDKKNNALKMKVKRNTGHKNFSIKSIIPPRDNWINIDYDDIWSS